MLMIVDPWYKTTLISTSLGARLALSVPQDVFSTQRIDEGTTLILENLAANSPETILDMGCGYGALGLPLAAKFLSAKIEMVDRDLLAVKWSEKNALENKLTNVKAYGSLGFRDLPKDAHYDWILCNVPARIGEPFIENLVDSGQVLLNEGGDLRLVVIRDLGPVLENLQKKNSWQMTEVARGERHIVYSFPKSNDVFQIIDPAELYFRDEVQFNGMKFRRPFDLGGDDPQRLSKGLPVLMDALPRDPRHKFNKILSFKCGYGIIPAIARARWKDSEVVAIDRDLLATTFTNLNVEGADVRESATFSEALSKDEKFDLVIGEISPSTGDEVAKFEASEIKKCLNSSGQAYLLCMDRVAKALTGQMILKRDGYTVLRLVAQ